MSIAVHLHDKQLIKHFKFIFVLSISLMKILILSCNTGEGHNSSAKAIKRYMDRLGLDSEIKDTLSIASPALSVRISKAYNYSIRGRLFYNLYNIGDFVSKHFTHIKSPVYFANRLYADKLYQYIDLHNFDAIIAVHLFAAEALTAIKRKHKMSLPTLFVMTDYTCIPFLSETELDMYAIAHQDLIDEFVSRGIPVEKIIATGIPVNRADVSLPKSEARDLANTTFGWYDSRGYWFMIMGGSMGFGDMERLIVELSKSITESDRIICVCGQNRELEIALSKQFADVQQVKILGYTDQIALLMDCCDVLFSKPGGITSTEALIRNIPLVHTAPIPGLEDKNAQFFHARNMSYYTQDLHQQVDVAIKLCRDISFREQMLKSQRENANSQTCEIIVNVLKGML